jgi:hypothetical protein
MQESQSTDRAYFGARIVDSGIETEGQAQASLGHQVPMPGGESTGFWASWRWDGSRLVVERDRYGAFPLFYMATDDRIVVSPSLPRILASGSSRALDLDALAAFAAIGYYLEDDTPFLDIRALAQGSTLTWSRRRLEVSAPHPPFVVQPMDRATAIEGVIETVRASVSRRIPSGGDPYVMPLSGGRDSRHLLLELRHQGHTPAMCVTAGYYPGIGGGQDRPLAKKLCASLGIPHRGIAVPRSLVEADQRKNRITGYLSDEHAWALAVADHLRGRTSHTYEGTPGGALIQRPWDSDGMGDLARARRFDEFATRLVVGKDGRDRYSQHLSPSMRELLPTTRAIARVRQALVPHERSDNPAMEFRFWNRGMRELMLTPALVLQDIPTVYTPYLDPEVVAFATSIGAELIGEGFHDDIISTAYPDVARVRYARFGKPAIRAALARSINRDLAQLLMRDSDGTLLDRTRLVRNAMKGAATGDPELAIGRRPSLITYLVQLEKIVREGPRLQP